MKFKNKKSLGQNFLIDKNILKKITDIGEISENDKVIEVGPGNGNLTECLINKNPKYLKIIEKDNELIKILSNKFKDQIEIFHNDILKVSEDFYDDDVIIYGNLPYNISTKILANWCLSKKIKFKKLILMFQKEVADRIIAEVNTKEYSRITILANWKYNVKKILDINPECFIPKPKIKSTLLEFIPKKNFIELKNPRNLEKITNLFFNQRRKMIKKNFMKLFKDFNIVSEKYNIKLTNRPQMLSINKFLMIIKEYEKNSN
tara:strand:+ start:8172 stop:8954 length:783 start_codon:yes stop_codon:yes gene_type:complete